MKKHLNSQLLLILMLLVLASQPGWAETVHLTSVRTGEHENFTRIVFEFKNTIQFNNPEIIGKGRFSVLFLDSSTDLPPLTVYETDRLQKVQSIKLSKDNSNLTAKVTLDFPDFTLKVFSLSDPDRLVVDATPVSTSSIDSVPDASLNERASSKESKARETKKHKDVTEKFPTNEVFKPLETKETVTVSETSPTPEAAGPPVEPSSAQTSKQTGLKPFAEKEPVGQHSLFPGNFLGSGGERKVIPSIAVREEYNDNIFLEEDEEDDFITTITPSLRMQQRTERFQGRLGARLDILSYADLDDLDHVDQTYDGSIGYQFTPLLNVSADALYQKDSRPDRDIVETGLVLNDEIRERRQFGSGMTYTLSEISQVTLSFRTNDDDYHDPEEYDSVTYQIQGLYIHDLSRWLPNTVGRIICSYGRYEYDQEEHDESQTFFETRNFRLSRTTDVDSYQVMVGVSKDWTERVNLLLDIGGSYTVTEFTDRLDEQIDSIFFDPFSRTIRVDDEQKEWGGVGQLVFTFTGEKSTAHLTFSQQVSGASGRSGASQRTAAIADVSQRFTDKLKGSLSAGYYFNKIDQSSNQGDDDEEETFRLRGSLRYDFTKYAYITGSYGFTSIDDKEDDETRQRNAVFLEVGMQHDLLN